MPDRWLDKDKAQNICQIYHFIHGKLCYGVIKYFLLSTNGTITAQTYCQYIQKMYEKLKIHRLALIIRQEHTLLHDNARPHTRE